MMGRCRAKLCFNCPTVSLLQWTLVPVIFAVGMSPMSRAQSSADSSKVVIEVVELEGSLLPEGNQEQLAATLKQREYDEDSDWIKEVDELVGRAETDGWPDRENQGYVGYSYSTQWKPLRREPGRVHVLVTISVNEGQPKKLKAIEFRYAGDRLGRPVFSSDDLRKLISLNDGEIYNRDRYLAGLAAVSRAYSERGFIECTVMPTVELDQVNQTVLVVDGYQRGISFE